MQTAFVPTNIGKIVRIVGINLDDQTAEYSVVGRLATYGESEKHGRVGWRCEGDPEQSFIEVDKFRLEIDELDI